MKERAPNDFAAFIMTYERPEILLNSISKLQAQSFPPRLILVVDNSESHASQNAVKAILNKNVVYRRVGYNSGPAGAANIGLQELTKMGFQWIYWGDDDNPPGDNGIFESFFQKIEELEEENVPIGVFGGKGAYFNKYTGRLRSLSNAELSKGKILKVDAVPGGHIMIVNSEVVKSGVLPTKKLFFGFEEFDFCLKVRKINRKNFVDAENWLQLRHSLNKTKKKYQWKASNFGEITHVRRDYYSSRNLLYIFYENKLFLPLVILLCKIGGKCILGFKYGKEYGVKNFKMQTTALVHFLDGKYGALK